MPFYRMHGDVMVHLKLGGKLAKDPPKACRARMTWSNGGIAMHHCCAMATVLCDGPKSEGRTCDMPMCPEHVAYVDGDYHLCAACLTAAGAVRLFP